MTHSSDCWGFIKASISEILGRFFTNLGPISEHLGRISKGPKWPAFRTARAQRTVRRHPSTVTRGRRKEVGAQRSTVHQPVFRRHPQHKESAGDQATSLVVRVEWHFRWGKWPLGRLSAAGGQGTGAVASGNRPLPSDSWGKPPPPGILADPPTHPPTHVPCPPLRKHGHGPKKPGKTAVQRPLRC